MMKYSILIRLAGVFVTLITMMSAGNIISNAQQLVWTPHDRIPDYNDLVGEQAPYLMTNKSRTVHSFNSQTMAESKAIMYRQWSLEQGWIISVDKFRPVR